MGIKTFWNDLLWSSVNLWGFLVVRFIKSPNWLPTAANSFLPLKKLKLIIIQIGTQISYIFSLFVIAIFFEYLHYSCIIKCLIIFIKINSDDAFKNKIDMSNSRNLVIVAVILVFGIGDMSLGVGNFQLAGIGLAGIIGVLLNIILPKNN